MQCTKNPSNTRIIQRQTHILKVDNFLLLCVLLFSPRSNTQRDNTPILCITNSQNDENARSSNGTQKFLCFHISFRQYTYIFFSRYIYLGSNVNCFCYPNSIFSVLCMARRTGEICWEHETWKKANRVKNTNKISYARIKNKKKQPKKKCTTRKKSKKYTHTDTHTRESKENEREKSI